MDGDLGKMIMVNCYGDSGLAAPQRWLQMSILIAVDLISSNTQQIRTATSMKSVSLRRCSTISNSPIAY